MVICPCATYPCKQQTKQNETYRNTHHIPAHSNRAAGPGRIKERIGIPARHGSPDKGVNGPEQGKDNPQQ